MRRAFAIGLVTVVLAVLFVGVVTLFGASGQPDLGASDPPAPEMVFFQGAESSFWPFLSTRQEMVNHSPINVVVLGATVDEVVLALGEAGWNRTVNGTGDAGDERFALNASQVLRTNLTWGQAGGASRYALVDDGQQARWIPQTEQLHLGSYFTNRLHMRLYDAPIQGEWVAIQVHTEHFDWFTLRHAVSGVQEAQRHVEADFMGQPIVDQVWRRFMGNHGPSDADGWATIVELGMVPGTLLLGAISLRGWARDHLTPGDREKLVALRDRMSWEHVFLVAAMFVLVLGVRLAGLVLEQQVQGLPPKVIAGTLYPFLALGLPGSAYLFAHRLEHRIDAALAAGGALAVASLLDYAFLSVDVLPIDLLLHRAGLVAAIGLVAAGAARRATRKSHVNGLVLAGFLGWFGLVTATLMGWI